MQVGNQRVIQSTLKKHIDKIKQRVNDYEEACQKQLNELKNQQDQRIKEISM